MEQFSSFVQHQPFQLYLISCTNTVAKRMQEQESQRWASSRRFKVKWETYSVNLSTSKTGSSSCQCTTTFHGEKWEKQKDVNTIHRQLRNMLANSLAVTGLSWGLDQKRIGTEPTPTNPTDPGIKLHRTWWWLSLDPVTQYSVPPVAFERWELRSKEHGKKSIHFNGSHENIELLLRSVISANQLSVFGAIADLCDELSEDLRASGKPAAPDHLETMEIPTGHSVEETQTNAQQWRNLVQEYERQFEQLSEDQKLSKLCSDAGLKLVELDSWNTRRTTDATFMQRIHDVSQWKGDSYKRMDSQEYEDRTSLDHKSLTSGWTIQCRSSSPIFTSRQYRFFG